MATTVETKILAEVERWKNYLLDFSRKNTLLYSKLGESRGLAEIVRPGFTPALRKIVFEDGPLYFPYKNDILELGPNEPISSIPLNSQLARCMQSNKNQSNFLYTSLDDDRLKSRLNGFRRRSLEALQEKGFNVLYTIFGSLRWKETADSTESQSAPLLVLPVKLLNSNKEPYFRVERIEDALQFNPTLREFLQRTYGFQLPEFLPEYDTVEEVEDWLRSVEKTLQDEKVNPLFHSWKVEWRVGLGLLSFAKIEIYEDLNRHTPEILANPLCREIAVSGELGDTEAPLDMSHMDRDFPPEDLYTIRDSDSSQLEALLAVQRGQNIVLDGPPGTGKSQTIANIIADCLGHGKRVLFVSEKLVALEVVKKWLDAENLGDFCLNCHDTKQPRKAIIHELERCMNLGHVSKSKCEKAFADLKERAAQLNRYAELLHEPQGVTGSTARQVLEELFLLEKAPKNTMWRVEKPMEIGESQYEKWGNLVREFQTAFNTENDSELPWNPEFAWFNAPIRELETTEKNDFFLSVERLRGAYQALLENQKRSPLPLLTPETQYGKLPEIFAKLGEILELDFEFPKEWFENSPCRVMDLFERTTEELGRREELQRSQAEVFRFDSDLMEGLNPSDVAMHLVELNTGTALELAKASQTMVRARITKLQNILQEITEKYQNPLFEFIALLDSQEKTLESGIFKCQTLRKVTECAKTLLLTNIIHTYDTKWAEILRSDKCEAIFNTILHNISYATLRNDPYLRSQLKTETFEESGFPTIQDIRTEFLNWRSLFGMEEWKDDAPRIRILSELKEHLARLNESVSKLVQMTGLTVCESVPLPELSGILLAIENFAQIYIFDSSWILNDNPENMVFERRRRELCGKFLSILTQHGLEKRFRAATFTEAGFAILTEPLKNSGFLRKLLYRKKLHAACEEARAFYHTEPQTDEEVLQDAAIFHELAGIWTKLQDLAAQKSVEGKEVAKDFVYLRSMGNYVLLGTALVKFGGMSERTHAILNDESWDRAELTQTARAAGELCAKIMELLSKQGVLMEATSQTSSCLAHLEREVEKEVTFAEEAFRKAQKCLQLYVRRPDSIEQTIRDLSQVVNFWDLRNSITAGFEENGLNVGQGADIESCFTFFDLCRRLEEGKFGITPELLIPFLENESIAKPEFTGITESAQKVLAQLETAENTLGYWKMVFPETSEWQSLSIETLSSGLNRVVGEVQRRAEHFTFLSQFLKNDADVEWSVLSSFVKFLSETYLPHEERLTKAFLLLGQMTGKGDCGTEKEMEEWKVQYENMVKVRELVPSNEESVSLSALFCSTESLTASQLRSRCRADLEVFQSLWNQAEKMEKALYPFFIPERVENFSNMCRERTLEQNMAQVTKWLENRSLYAMWLKYQDLRKRGDELGLTTFLDEFQNKTFPESSAKDVLRKRFLLLWLDDFRKAHPEFSEYWGGNLDNLTIQFQNLDRSVLQMNSARIRERLLNDSTRPTCGVPTATVPAGEIKILKHEATKVKRHLRLRQLFSEISNLLIHLKPCMMMSPSAVSMYLSGQTGLFDVVIFDEASQLNPWDAINAIYRGKQIVVAGDDKQLPPTSYFTTVLEEFDEDEDVANEEELEREDRLAFFESLLSVCKAKNFHNYRLQWHYRSLHEPLIAFSNRFFYDSELITFPSPTDSEFRNAISYHYLENGYWQTGGAGLGAGCNPVEARKTAELVIEHYRKHPEDSLGVLTPNQKQQELVEDILAQLRREDTSIDELMERAENPDGREPFFIKNLETVQGDERDYILFSVGYGPDEKTKRVALRFGPLNKSGGERRLNVAITRARKHFTVLTSMRSCDFNPSGSKNEGPKMLQRYLQYAESGTGLPGSMDSSKVVAENALASGLLENELARRLAEHGLKVERAVGYSSCRLDLVVRHPQRPEVFLLAIESDGASYRNARNARSRNRLREQVLRARGWKYLRIWTTDLYESPEKQIQRILALCTGAE